ncbi:MAG TPA: site-2 protease family protein [Jatrophihabitans sp.]|nr:site-2 protease family protein [Jatrophihabitans sp.]
MTGVPPHPPPGGPQRPHPGQFRPLRVGLPLGRIRGVPIFVTPSWLLIALLLTSAWGPVVREFVDDIGSVAAYLVTFGFTLVFGLCVLAHELGHTLVSLWLGYPVRRVFLFALGGISEVEDEPRCPRHELLIAAAGPLVSVLISTAAWFGYQAAPSGALITALLALLWWSNLLLAVFNLLPGLPLDGGRLMRAAVWGCGASVLTSTRVAAWTGRVVAIGVAVLGLAVDRSSGQFAATIFSIALAAYLWFGAGQSLRAATLTARLPGVSVDRLLRPGMFVSPDVSIAEALRRAAESHARGLVVLDTTNEPSAIVDELLVSGVPEERRPWTPISSVARPLEPGLILPVDIDAAGLLQRMQTTPAHEYLVLRADGSAAGLISARDFAAELRGVLRTA